MSKINTTGGVIGVALEFVFEFEVVVGGKRHVAFVKKREFTAEKQAVFRRLGQGLRGFRKESIICKFNLFDAEKSEAALVF